NDGYLDLGVAQNSGASQLWKNSGDATNSFSNVSAAAGWNSFLGSNAIGIAWGDYDGDGYLDVAMAYNSGVDETIVHNNQNGTFTKTTFLNGTGDDNWSVAWGDYDNDGKLDLAVGGNGSVDYVTLYHNEVTGFAKNKISSTLFNSQGISWGDYDSDGDIDLAV